MLRIQVLMFIKQVFHPEIENLVFTVNFSVHNLKKKALEYQQWTLQGTEANVVISRRTFTQNWSVKWT